jgi:hypothetical protein
VVLDAHARRNLSTSAPGAGAARELPRQRSRQGYGRCCFDHVQQADKGADFGFSGPAAAALPIKVSFLKRGDVHSPPTLLARTATPANLDQLFPAVVCQDALTTPIGVTARAMSRRSTARRRPQDVQPGPHHIYSRWPMNDPTANPTSSGSPSSPTI